MKDIQPKGGYTFIIMKNCIRKFMRLNMKISEEDRYYYHKKDELNLPDGFEWKR